MIKDNVKIDVCEWLKDKLIDNLGNIKKDKKGTFIFGSLLVCLMLHITKQVPGIGNKKLGFDILVGKQLSNLLNSMDENKEKNINEYFQALKARMNARVRLSQEIVNKYKDDICFVIKKDEIWMEAVIQRTIWVTKMGYEIGDHIIETYAKALLEAPKEPKEEVFGSVETIENQIQSKKRVKKVEATVRRGSRQAKAIKEDVLKQTGITEDELQAQQPETHLSPVATSLESDMLAAFKRVVRKREPSPVSTPSPRRTRQKQQAVRPPAKKTTPKKKKLTPKKRTQQNIAPIDRLLDEIIEEGKLKNINQLYDSLSVDGKEKVENSVILHLDIYKKFLMQIVDEVPVELFKRLEARRQAVIELDKKIKIEKLLVVYLVNSPKEIDDMISEANCTIFSTAHRHVALMVGRVNEVAEETANAWDIFLVEKEKKEEYINPKPIKVYQKDEDKGKGKVGGPPSIKITDNLPPPFQDTPSVTTIDDQLADESMDISQEDTNPNSEVLYIVDIDTQKVKIMVDKDTTGKTDMASESPVTNNMDNP